MPRIELAPGVIDDFDRILDHLKQSSSSDGARRIRSILAAIDVLQTSPHIGRPADDELRELIIGRGAQGDVTLYRYAPELDTVFVLAVRSQREAGYRQV